MIGRGSKVTIIGIGKSDEHYPQRKDYINREAIVESINITKPGGMFHCWLRLKAKVRFSLKQIKFQSVRLKETR